MKFAPGRAPIASMVVGGLIFSVILVTLVAVVLGLTQGWAAGRTAAVVGAAVALIFLSGILPLWLLASRSPATLLIVAMSVYLVEFLIFGVAVSQREDTVSLASGPVIGGAIAALAGWLAGMSVGLMNSRSTVVLPYYAPDGDREPVIPEQDDDRS